MNYKKGILFITLFLVSLLIISGCENISLSKNLKTLPNSKIISSSNYYSEEDRYNLFLSLLVKKDNPNFKSYREKFSDCNPKQLILTSNNLLNNNHVCINIDVESISSLTEDAIFSLLKLIENSGESPLFIEPLIKGNDRTPDYVGLIRFIFSECRCGCRSTLDCGGGMHQGDWHNKRCVTSGNCYWFLRKCRCVWV